MSRLSSTETPDAGTATEGSDDPDPAPETDDAGEELLAELLATITDELGAAVVGSHLLPGDLWVRVTREAWLETAQFLRTGLGFAYFNFLSGIDWMPPISTTKRGSIGRGISTATPCTSLSATHRRARITCSMRPRSRILRSSRGRGRSACLSTGVRNETVSCWNISALRTSSSRSGTTPLPPFSKNTELAMRGVG